MISLGISNAKAQTNADRKAELDSSFVKYNNEIGVFGPGAFGANDLSEEIMLGLQHKKWLKPNLSYRILGGFNPYSFSHEPRIVNYVGTDSIKVLHNNLKANRFFAGVGLEVQRHFYKRVYLFASLDLIGGYGVGHRSTYSYKHHTDSTGMQYITNRMSDYQEISYRSAYLKLVPNVGGKIVFGRTIIGGEMSLGQFGVISEKVGEGERFWGADFNLIDKLSLRLSFAYRFHS